MSPAPGPPVAITRSNYARSAVTTADQAGPSAEAGGAGTGGAGAAEVSPLAGPAGRAAPSGPGASVVGAPVTKSNRQTSQNRPDLGVWHTGQDGCRGSAPAGTLLAGPAPVGAAAAGSPIRRPHASQ